MTTLYRVFDESGGLLYVGISDQPWVRFTQHASIKSWWPSIAAVQLQQFGDRSMALAAEAEAIRTEAPMHNGGASRRPHRRSTPAPIHDLGSGSNLDRAAHAYRMATYWRRRGDEALALAYTDDSMSLREIAKLLGLTVEGIRQKLMTLGVELRSRGGRR